MNNEDHLLKRIDEAIKSTKKTLLDNTEYKTEYSLGTFKRQPTLLSKPLRVKAIRSLVSFILTDIDANVSFGLLEKTSTISDKINYLETISKKSKGKFSYFEEDYSIFIDRAVKDYVTEMLVHFNRHASDVDLNSILPVKCLLEDTFTSVLSSLNHLAMSKNLYGLLRDKLISELYIHYDGEYLSMDIETKLELVRIEEDTLTENKEISIALLSKLSNTTIKV